jgi:hypothetical protein
MVLGAHGRRASALFVPSRTLDSDHMEERIKGKSSRGLTWNLFHKASVSY